MDTKEKCLTKGKEYIIKSLKGNAIVFESDFDENHEWLISEIDTDFTIKRYTITDLNEKKIAVKLTKKDDFYKICDLLGYTPNSGDYSFTEYHAVDEDNEFVWCNFDWLKDNNYTLVPSIDLIDLEEKEETKEVINEAFYIQKLESEINRLKGELDKWKDEAALWNTRYHHVLSNLTDKTNELNKLRESPQISQDLTKRERMAWELVVHSNIQYEKAFEMVKDFLAKSNQI